MSSDDIIFAGIPMTLSAAAEKLLLTLVFSSFTESVASVVDEGAREKGLDR